MDRLQKANRIEQWSKLMPHGCHHIAIQEKVVPFVFSHLSKNLDASTVLKIKSANFVCWLHTVGHTCIFLKDERHSARTIVLKNWHIPVDWVDSFSHWIWRHNSTLRVCKGFPINFMTMGRKSQYIMASWFITLTSRCTSLSIVHRRCNVFYVEWIL